MSTKSTISLVLPVFNEEENIEHAVQLCGAALAQYSRDYEIIVVDDASTDRSAAIVERLRKEDSHLVLIRHSTNQKLGAALRSGFSAARMALVLYMDADLPVDPNDIGRALRAMEVTRADVIAGYRFDRTTEGVQRSIYSSVYNGLIGLLFGMPYRDINFAFKLMKAEVLDAIELKSEGSLIDAELILKAKNLGFTVQQVGLDYFPRSKGRSSLSSPGVIFKIFRELFLLYPDIRHPRRKSSAEHRVPDTSPPEILGR